MHRFIITTMLVLQVGIACGMTKKDLHELDTEGSISAVPDYFAGYTARSLLEKENTKMQMPVFIKKKMSTLLLKEDVAKLASLVRQGKCDDDEQQYVYAGTINNYISDVSDIFDRDAKSSIRRHHFVISKKEIPTRYSHTFWFSQFVVANSHDPDECTALRQRVLRDFIQLFFKANKESWNNPYKDIPVFKEQEGYYIVQGTLAEVMYQYRDYFVHDNYTLVVKDLSEKQIKKADPLYQRGLAIFVGEAQNEKKAEDLAHYIWYQHTHNSQQNNEDEIL